MKTIEERIRDVREDSGLTSEEFVKRFNVDGEVVKVIADKNIFPEGFTQKDAAEYYEIAKALNALGLNHEDLKLLLQIKEAGITLQDIEMLKRLKEIGIKMG
ncbi:hypothetical protein [Clostridium thermarum]|uniref:hypothetical protein n=1 Tax=Clostridium thermarum TaxID=1716543 RepID=UPI00112418F1|nr:hypothetical protein [Clostridium thermarum]